MPTRWTLDLIAPLDLTSTPYHDHLHALACTFFQEQADAHHNDEKPFAVRINGTAGKCTGIVLTWLPDTPIAALPPESIRLGHQQADITAAHPHRVPARSLATRSTGRRATLTITTPAKFRHQGRDYPLPDPYLIYSTLSRRYRAHLQPDLPDDTVRELTRTAVIYHHDIHTEPFTWHNNRSAGFVGTITLGLPHTSTPQVRHLFHTLNTFATHAGLGHGTTHGLGATALAVMTNTGKPDDQER